MALGGHASDPSAWEVPSPLPPDRLRGLGAAGEGGALGHQDPADASRLLHAGGVHIQGLTVRYFVGAGEHDSLENYIFSL